MPKRITQISVSLFLAANSIVQGCIALQLAEQPSLSPHETLLNPDELQSSSIPHEDGYVAPPPSPVGSVDSAIEITDDDVNLAIIEEYEQRNSIDHGEVHLDDGKPWFVSTRDGKWMDEKPRIPAPDDVAAALDNNLARIEE